MNLKIISSNIRFDNPMDGEHSWAKRCPLLKEIYDHFHPDILGTQEGREIQIRQLAGIIDLKLIEGHREWIHDRMYPCLFVNEEKIKVHRSGDIWLSETPHVPGSHSFKSSFPRLCTWIEVTLLVNQQDYFIVNTHLDHVLEETRIEQIKVLIKEVKKTNYKNLPIILMGDFNDSPEKRVREIITEELQLKDPWFELSLSEETSHHGFKGQETDGDRIDWILIPNSFSVESIYLEKKSFEGLYPSDHYPLLATLIPR